MKILSYENSLECDDCGDLFTVENSMKFTSGNYCGCCGINHTEEIQYPKFSYADFLAGK